MVLPIKSKAWRGYWRKYYKKPRPTSGRINTVEVQTVANPPDAEPIAESERLYQKVRAKIEALGPVNAQAMEEYQEAQQRQDFLSAQRQDLLDSIRDTEKAIAEIDSVSRNKFAEAFERINANFREAFQTLFGGGTGEMRLTDETNMADSGIDIVASPPARSSRTCCCFRAAKRRWPRWPC